MEQVQVEGFPGYSVTSDGDVWSMRWNRPHKLKPAEDQKGYYFVILRRGNQNHHRLVHHLILRAFRGSRPTGKVCRHLDSNPLNNSLANLEWATQSENMSDKKGTRYNPLGRVNAMKAITLRSEGMSYRTIARILNTKTDNVVNAIKGKTFRRA